MKVAIANGSQNFHNNNILQRAIAEKFPGTLWIHHLAKLLESADIDVVTSDIALKKIAKSQWNAGEVLVIQELDAQEGKKLISAGAIPFVLTGLESPLFAYNFYDQISSIALKFHHRFLYSGLFKSFAKRGGTNHDLYFPSFEKKDILPVKSWQQRKFLVLVISNKFWQGPLKLPLFRNLKIYPKWLMHQWQMKTSPNRNLAIQNELQTKRLEAIEYFGKKNKLDLYGKGWESLENLPKNWQQKLQNLDTIKKSTPIKDKLKTISSYKFAICFENVSYPGHITEKIIDCFVAGIIPIYLGPENINYFIPKDTFINMRDFKSWQDLNDCLLSFSKKDAQKMLQKARKFITGIGSHYSYEEFANNLAQLILNSLKRRNK